MKVLSPICGYEKFKRYKLMLRNIKIKKKLYNYMLYEYLQKKKKLNYSIFFIKPIQ